MAKTAKYNQCVQCLNWNLRLVFVCVFICVAFVVPPGSETYLIVSNCCNID